MRLSPAGDAAGDKGAAGPQAGAFCTSTIYTLTHGPLAFLTAHNQRPLGATACQRADMSFTETHLECFLVPALPTPQDAACSKTAVKTLTEQSFHFFKCHAETNPATGVA